MDDENNSGVERASLVKGVKEGRKIKFAIVIVKWMELQTLKTRKSYNNDESLWGDEDGTDNGW